MNTYILSVKNDRNTIKFTVIATDRAAAKAMLMKAENCPESAIKKCEFQPRMDVISPDGFCIDPSTDYANFREAKKAFMVWKKRFVKQGYYSSARYGRIDLRDLPDFCQWKMTEEEQPETEAEAGMEIEAF